MHLPEIWNALIIEERKDKAKGGSGKLSSWERRVEVSFSLIHTRFCSNEGLKGSSCFLHMYSLRNVGKCFRLRELKMPTAQEHTSPL